MTRINLNARRGLPMYFMHNPVKNENITYRTDFSDSKPAQVNDEYELGNFVFKISEIESQRVSPLDYGVSVPVTWQRVKSKLTHKIEFKNSQRVETPVNA
jgi:hypothetical protein